MKKLNGTVPLFIFSLISTGCVNQSQQLYESQLRSIESAYQAKKITEAEYLKLKMEAENAYAQRKATVAAGVLSGGKN